MAEAHQAISYSESLIHQHSNANHDQEVLQLVWQSGWRSWKKRFAKFRSGVRNGLYPAHLESLWVVLAIVLGLHFTVNKVPYNLVNRFASHLPSATVVWQVAACCVVAFADWVLIILVLRYTLKLLLMYKGYMHEQRGRPISFKTKTWAMLVKVFMKWNSPSLYSFQGSLPRLPVPAVKDTISRYLRSVRPLLDDENFKRVSKESREFEKGIASRLQRYLTLKSWWAPNYVSDWWEEYVYLRSRNPLMGCSNFYGMDYISHRTKSQSARAASISHLLLLARRRIERQELKPIMAQGLVPLCSWQYERMFNTFREPGVEGDKIVHYDDSKHIVVFHKGCYYKMPIYHQGRLLTPIELKHQYDQILKMNVKPTHGEKHVGALTGMNRTKWAEARIKFFSNGINKLTLQTIETAAFFCVLDDEPYTVSFDHKEGEAMNHYAKLLLLGKGNDRWFDKSFSIIVGTNGRFGINAEHTWADAPVALHVFEEFVQDDVDSYDESGNLLGTIGFVPPTPTRLAWDFGNAELVKTIDEAFDGTQKLIEEVEHRIVVHDAFGKGFVKTCRLSPDAFIQMALQLAYYRDFGKFSLTYEASMTRLFREGRTETVRSCTIESSAWVKAMEDKSSSSEERVRLLNEACKRHQTGYQDAMCGRGVDRHLFCLYVVSKYLEVESPFLQEVISEPWGLSTSQTPHGQIDKTNLTKYPGLMSPGGGFGPVSYEGVSVSYIVSGEDMIFFHVSSNKSCPLTDTKRFADRIVQAMADIKLLFEDYRVSKQQQNGKH